MIIWAIVFSLILFGALILHNARRNKLDTISVTLILSAALIWFVVIFQPTRIGIGPDGLTLERQLKEANEKIDHLSSSLDRTGETVASLGRKIDQAARAQQELLAVSSWNLGDGQDQSKWLSASLLKQLYGDQYQSRTKRLINMGAIKATPQEELKFLKISPESQPSSQPAYFEFNFGKEW